MDHKFTALVLAGRLPFTLTWTRRLRMTCTTLRVELAGSHHANDAADSRFWKRAAPAQLLQCVQSGKIQARTVCSDALNFVCSRGMVGVLQTILSAAPASFPWVTRRGLQTGLACAVETGRAEVVSMLLVEPRVDPAARRTYALKKACRRGYTAVLQAYLTYCPPGPWCSEALRYAAEDGRRSLVEMLLQHPAVDPAEDNSYALRTACRDGHLLIAKLLLADGRSEPRAENSFALRLAAYFGRTDIVQLLLEDGRVDTQAERGFAVRWASMNGHKDVVQLLQAHPV